LKNHFLIIWFKKFGTMSIVYRTDIIKLIDDKELIIEPMLDNAKQIGEVSIDLRLGIDFLIPSRTRNPYIDIDHDTKPLRPHFKKTRRQFGEQLILYPNQTVLCSSLEYIKLPQNIMAEVKLRSSYNRLGLSLATMVQPGYCGCISLELSNLNNNAINLTTGARVAQISLFKIPVMSDYFHRTRKYMCQVRPVLSQASNDSELQLLKEIRSKYRR